MVLALELSLGLDCQHKKLDFMHVKVCVNIIKKGWNLSVGLDLQHTTLEFLYVKILYVNCLNFKDSSCVQHKNLDSMYVKILCKISQMVWNLAGGRSSTFLIFKTQKFSFPH